MTDEQALKALIDAGAKLLRYWQLPDPKAPHVVGKNPEGLGDWHRISAGGAGATLESCLRWLRGEGCTVADFVTRVVEPHARRYPDKKPIPVPASVKPGIGLLPASIGKLVVDVDLASKRALKTMTMPVRRDRAIAGLAAVDAALRTPDGSQTTPSDGLHLYYPADGIPAAVTDNATWAIDEGGVKVGGDLRGTNGWVGVYDLPALAMMVEAGHGPALDVEALRAFVNNPHRKAGKREYRNVRAGGGSTVQAACAAIRSAEAGDTYAGRNPTIVHHVAVLANNKLLDDAAAKAVLDAVAEVKPEAIADTERFIGKARRYFAESTGNTGGPAGVRGEPRPGHDTGEIPGGAAGDGGAQGGDPDRDEPDSEDDAIGAALAQWQGHLDAFREHQDERKPRTLRQLREAASDALAVLVDRDGADRGSGSDEIGQLRELATVFREGGAEAVKAKLREWEQRGIVADPVEWAEAAPEREWLVPGWLPVGRIGMVTGKGEFGKSRLTLQLAAVLARGGPLWIPAYGNKANLSVPIGADRDGVAWGKVPGVVATWEDEADELRRRLHDMAGVGLKPGDVAGKLHHADMSGAGPLWAPARGGSGHVATMGALTGAGRWLRRWCEPGGCSEKGARLLVIDPLAAAFACSENDRGLVRAFMSDWDNWARATGCAVLVVSHPSKASDGSTDYAQSGSTDWHAASRFAWLMERKRLGKDERKREGGKPVGEDERPEAMRLEVTKSNYLVGRKPGTWLKPEGAGWLAVDEAGLVSGTGGRFGGGR